MASPVHKSQIKAAAAASNMTSTAEKAKKVDKAEQARKVDEAEQAKKVDAAVEADDEPPATVEVVVETARNPAKEVVAEQVDAFENFPKQAAADHAVKPLPPREEAKDSEMKVYRKKEQETWAKLFSFK